MPYSAEHKEQTRARIVDCARRLFNRRGFAEVSIDEIMAKAGLTRGGFYNHFKTKVELYHAAVADFIPSDPSERCVDAAPDLPSPGAKFAHRIVNAYLSRHHLDDLERHCPMIALPSDVARAGPALRTAYQQLLEGMIAMFEGGLIPEQGPPRERAVAMATLCVGGMVLARTLEDERLRDEILKTARRFALKIGSLNDAAGGDN